MILLYGFEQWGYGFRLGTDLWMRGEGLPSTNRHQMDHIRRIETVVALEIARRPPHDLGHWLIAHSQKAMGR